MPVRKDLHIRIGTRRSPLALAQTNYVIGLIKAKHPDIEFSLHPIQTMADKDRVSEFHQFGVIGVFSNEHEQQLVSREVDFVVHSLKDLPTTLREGLTLGCVPGREDPRDALCGATLSNLRQGARVGTGSLRRRAQMLALRPDVEIVPIRGNVGPRLRKIEGEDGLDAVILAEAGLQRLGLGQASSEVLDPLAFPYAVGQGALGLETCTDTPEILALIREIEDTGARAEVDAERAMMHDLGAGCSLPVGVHTVRDGEKLTMFSQISALDGERTIVSQIEGRIDAAEALGLAAAADLKSKGGMEILESSYRTFCAHFRLTRG